jgi:hypothetical protein
MAIDDPSESIGYETFAVSTKKRAGLVAFIEEALRASGCVLLNRSRDGQAPFRFSFITPTGERLGIIAYAFLANSIATKNRPHDEHRFQIKYGSKEDRLHELWQDPFGLYTTLLVGINPEEGFFVGADPVLNSPTKFFISKEFKQEQVDHILTDGWHIWERDQRRPLALEPTEVLVGGTASNFLRWVLLEREVVGEDQGHRQLVAEQTHPSTHPLVKPSAGDLQLPSIQRLHELEAEFQLSSQEILEVIAQAPRLKMAVRGWVAERHLKEVIERLPEVRRVETIPGDGQPDLVVSMKGLRRSVTVECKNVLRNVDRNGRARLDFMRTRAAKSDPCSRYYSPKDFDVVAACLHAQTEKWEFAARLTSGMAPHPTCAGKLLHRVVIDGAWNRELAKVLTTAAA